MLQQIRDGASGWISKVIIGLLVLVMALFGFGNIDFFSGGEPTVAEVNGEEITTRVFEDTVERARARNSEQFDDSAIRMQVLDSLIRRALILQDTAAAGLVAAAGQISERITSDPTFQTDGKFDRAKLEAILTSSRISGSDLKDDFQQSITIEQFFRGVQSSEFATDTDVRLIGSLAMQSRDVQWIEFSMTEYLPRVQVDDAEVQPYFEANQDKFLREETVTVDYVEISPNDLLDEITVDDAAVRALYDQRRPFDVAHIELKITASRDETKTRELAESIANRFAAGETFETLAQSLSEDLTSKNTGGSLGLLDGAAVESLFGSEHRATLLSLASDALSMPIKVNESIHLVRMRPATVEEYAPFEDQAEALREESKQTQARELLNTKRPALEDQAYEESLEDLAKQYGVELRRSPGFTRLEGEGIAADATFREAAFADEVLNNQSWNSPVFAVGDSLISLRIASREPARALSFEEAKGRARQGLILERAKALALADRQQLLTAVKEGKDFVALATALGRTVERRQSLQRGQMDVPPAVAERAFQLPHPASGRLTFGATDGTDSGAPETLYVVVVRGVQPGSTIAAEQQNLGNLVTSLLSQRSIESYLSYLENHADIDREDVPSEAVAGDSTN